MFNFGSNVGSFMLYPEEKTTDDINFTVEDLEQPEHDKLLDFFFPRRAEYRSLPNGFYCELRPGPYTTTGGGKIELRSAFTTKSYRKGRDTREFEFLVSYDEGETGREDLIVPFGNAFFYDIEEDPYTRLPAFRVFLDGSKEPIE